MVHKFQLYKNMKIRNSTNFKGTSEREEIKFSTNLEFKLDPAISGCKKQNNFRTISINIVKVI